MLVISCGTYSMEGAKGISPDELAILETKIEGCSDCIYVSDIDGKSRGYGYYKTYELIPGERSITVYGNSQLGFAKNATDIVFNAEAGKIYYLNLVSANNGYWIASINDKQTKKQVDHEQHSLNCKLSLLGGWKCKR